MTDIVEMRSVDSPTQRVDIERTDVINVIERPVSEEDFDKPICEVIRRNKPIALVYGNYESVMNSLRFPLNYVFPGK